MHDDMLLPSEMDLATFKENQSKFWFARIPVWAKRLKPQQVLEFVDDALWSLNLDLSLSDLPEDEVFERMEISLRITHYQLLASNIVPDPDDIATRSQTIKNNIAAVRWE